MVVDLRGAHRRGRRAWRQLKRAVRVTTAEEATTRLTRLVQRRHDRGRSDNGPLCPRGWVLWPRVTCTVAVGSGEGSAYIQSPNSLEGGTKASTKVWNKPYQVLYLTYTGQGFRGVYGNHTRGLGIRGVYVNSSIAKVNTHWIIL